MMQGGKFLSGAAAGFLGHLGGAAWGEVGGNFAKETAGIVAFGALSGGVGAELTGGNFWQGAVTGGIVAGLNTAMHNGGDPKPKKNYKKFFRTMLNSFNPNLPTVDGNISAMDHYYGGNSRPAQLGSNTIKALLNSKDYMRIQTRLVTGQAQVLNFTARVDLTFDGAFFVGRTPLTYSTSCNSSTCITSFSAFGGDSFSDPLDLGFEPSMAGPGGGAAAQPYNFIPVRFSIQYANPGYPVNR